MRSLDEVNKYLNSLSEEERQRVIEDSLRLTQNRLWLPNPGPQTMAFESEADELLYGGQAGGGKTDLVAGLSLTEHKRSLVLRRTNKEAIKLVERYQEILGTRDGWNGQEGIWRLPDGRIVDIGGCQNEEDKQKYKGTPHDLKAFDELVDFSESQYLFITIWNRSADPDQRCRIVATTNPPTQAEGLWVIKRWGPWLDPRHPNPAKPGELRWFLRQDKEDGTVEEKEVDGPGPYKVSTGIAGQFEWVRARSRTFIRSTLADNPDLARTDYGSMLNSLPKELREAYKDGRFDIGLKDHPMQAIPTSWVLQAIERRRKMERPDVPMSCLAVDIAQGGDDQTVISTRYWGWFSDLVSVPGRLTPDGSSAAGLVVKHRRGQCPVVIDMGGGYGGSCYEHLKENDTRVFGHKGATTSTARTKDNILTFFNKRSEVIWKFREALDPDQEGGSMVGLPDDPEMIADLTAPTFQVVRGGIKVESKEDVVERLKRSTDKGDSVVMCWSRGDKPGAKSDRIGGSRGRKPQVQVGYPSVRRHSGRHSR